jgi:hypothetical protein
VIGLDHALGAAPGACQTTTVTFDFDARRATELLRSMLVPDDNVLLNGHAVADITHSPWGRAGATPTVAWSDEREPAPSMGLPRPPVSA